MSRIARIVNVGYPHHIIQRGNRRQKVFFNDDDKRLYLRLLREQGDRFGIEYWAYCLMDNHVHLIAVPSTETSLAQGVGEAHRLYTKTINCREEWRGYLWQGRFSSSPLDEGYVYNAIRYVERNPVRAGLVKKAYEFKWSSAAAHVDKRKDPLLSPFYLLQEIKDWKEYLQERDEEKNLKMFRKHSSTGRPLGKISFVKSLETKTGRILRKQKPGPKSQ